MNSIGHLLVILMIVLILFGARRIPEIMKEIAKGLKIFRDEMSGDKSDQKKECDDEMSQKNQTSDN